MPSPLQDLIIPNSKQFVWVEHTEDTFIGPFKFEAMQPIPVAAPDNRFAQQSWLYIPFPGRPPVPSSLEGQPGEGEIDGSEVLRAFLEGHLPKNAEDYYALVDQIGRCLLIHANFGIDQPYHSEVEQIFASVEEGATLFDLLLRNAKGRVHEGTFMAEAGRGEEALIEFTLSRLCFYGAHLISPTTPGVLYDLGVLTHDMATRLSFDKESDRAIWEKNMASESRYFLQLAMADEEIRTQTPAYYLLGINREILGDLGEAKSAYNRFLASEAAGLYPVLKKEVEQRLKSLDIPGDPKI